MSDPASAEGDDFTVTSAGGSVEPPTEPRTPPPEAPDPAEDEPEPSDPEAERVSKAASELGKRSAEAAAAKRAEKAGAEEKLGKPRDDPRARMLEATRKEAEAKRLLAAERERAERAEQRLAERDRPKEPIAPKPPADEKPKQEDFETYEDFVDARSAYVAKQEFAKQYETRRQEAFQRYQATSHMEALEKHVGAFNERLAGESKSDPEWMSRVSPDVINLRPSFVLHDPRQARAENVIADEITRSETPKALMLHLTSHPEDFQRLATLQSRYDIAREMAKIEARLGAASTATAPKAEISKAKDPVRPVIGTPHAADAVPGDDSSFDEHFRFYEAKEARRR